MASLCLQNLNLYEYMDMWALLTTFPKEHVTRSAQWRVTPSRNKLVEAVRGHGSEHRD
jgi:hypothetical protein